MPTSCLVKWKPPHGFYPACQDQKRSTRGRRSRRRPDAFPEVGATGGVDHTRTVGQCQLPEVLGPITLELELGVELRAEVGQVMIIQLGVRHQRLPIERFRFLPVDLRILALVWEDGPFRPRESDSPKLI